MIRHWLSQEWKAVLAISAFILIVVSWFLYAQDRLSGEFDPVPAVVSKMRIGGTYQSKVVVEATTEGGLVGRTSVDIGMVRGCEIGDAIRAEKKDKVVKIYPRPCRE